MWNGLQRWFRRRTIRGARRESDESLARDAKVQELELELAERESTIAALQRTVEHMRSAESSQIVEMAQARTERLITESAPPVVQLLAQAHLSEVEGKPLQVHDVLLVAKRLIRVLEDEGLILEEKTGETVPYDPLRHDLLIGPSGVKAGHSVIVRFQGVGYRGKLVRKAIVEAAEN